MLVPRLGLVGIGLMGASLSLALRQAGAVGRVIGLARSEHTRQEALARGIVDEIAPSLQALAGAVDVLVLCVPTLSVETVLAELGELPAGLVVTDVASVKGNVVEAARRVWGVLPPGFVPGHPIAGSEKSGVTAGKADLYRQHKVILTPDERTAPEALALVTAMWEAAGAEVVHMGVEEHDRVLAFTSHLPHVLAFALVDALSRQQTSVDIFRFAAGGFRDFTRIAASDPQMWHDIVLANRQAVLAGLDAFEVQVAALRQAISNGDSDTLLDTFRHAKAERERFGAMLAARQAGADHSAAGE